ncbi:hypothetical protein T05_2382 [Trichinella murrelli]|uniref:Uncharacterized protein n=1 Tax=Trichinella murrelli TaxID=144512 RepID=A0A0V0TFT3_9BILA|nr:hypothetical protein T05_2382 [Trichinella murrelli]
MPIVEKSFLYTCSSIFKLVPIKILCNGPLPRAGSSASSTRLLARLSLFGKRPVLTGAFPFLYVSRFPDGIATIKQQTMSIYFIKQSEARTDDAVTTNTLFWQLANRSCKQPLPYSASDLHVQFFIRKNFISSVHVRCTTLPLMKSTSRAHFLRLYEISEPGWSPRLSPLPLSALGSFSFTTGRSVLPAVPFHHPPSLPGTYSNPASSGLGTDRPNTPQVWSLWGVASTPDRQARRQVRRLFGLSKPFGVVVPGRLSFGPPRTPAPNLCAGAARTPLRTSLVHPSALRTSDPLAAGALCRTEHDWEWLRLCSERWSDKPAVSGRDRRPNLLDGRWTPSLACPAVCGSSALPSRLTAGGKRWPGFSSRQTAGTPPSPVPTRSSGLGRSAVSPAHHSGRRHRSLEPLPPCAPQRWAGGTPPAIWRSSRTPLGCSDYHSVSPPGVPQGP